MSESLWTRRISFAATVVGLLTALIAVVGWIATKSVRDSLSIALPIAGAVYLLGLLLGNGYFAVVAVWKRQWEAARAFGLVFAFLLVPSAFALFGGNPREDLLVFGTVGLVATVWFGVQLGRVPARARRAAQQAADDAAHKTCPDCCERVKAEAHVCRYCGWRFAPPPNQSGRRRAHPDAPHTTRRAGPHRAVRLASRKRR